MLRILGLLAFSCAVGTIGFLYCEKITRRKKYLEKMTLFAVNCSGVMRSSHRSIFEIFKEYGESELQFLQKLDAETINDRSKVCELLDSFGINKSDRAVVADFIVQLGCGDIREQMSHCEYYKLKFEQLFADAQKDADSKGKLYKTLFVLLGVALFIILI